MAKGPEWVAKMQELGIDITPRDDGLYFLNRGITYTSPRYKKEITAHIGVYDGATRAIDIPSLSWIIHDQICNYPFFDDESPIKAWQAATILSDILAEEGRYVRSVRWRIWTFLFGCVKSRENGWF